MHTFIRNTYIHARTHAYIHTCTHTYIHTYVHTHTHIHAHIHSNTYIHIHEYTEYVISFVLHYFRINLGLQKNNIKTHYGINVFVTTKKFKLLKVNQFEVKDYEKTDGQ